MLRFFDSKTGKAISLTMVAVFLSQFVMPTLAYALTSGPAQPEFSSFEPVETTQMVDPYSGDFTYNIPLLSVPGPNGGYPINMSYHSNVGMEEEASWVGLGWSLNIGAINRQLRGVPDDFSGNKISYESYVKPNYAFGLNIPTNRYSRELFGFPLPDPADPVSTFHPQVYYNSYNGVGYRVSFAPKCFNPENSPFGLGLNFDSQSGGFGIEPNLNLSFKLFKNLRTYVGLGIGASVGINSMDGLEGVNFESSLGFQRAFTLTSKKSSSLIQFGGKLNSSIGFSTQASVPAPQMPIAGKSGSFDIKFPIQTLAPNSGNVTFIPPAYSSKTYRWLYYTGYYSSSESKYDHSSYTKPAYGYLYTPSVSSAAAYDAIIDRTNDPIPYSKNVPYLSSVSFNYDLFNMTGQGIGGMFRPYRSEIGILSPSHLENVTEVNNLNYEVGASSTAAHIGIDLNANDGQNVQYTGTWTNGNELSNDLKYGPDHSKFREPYYFQMYGEKTAVDLAESFLTTWGGDQAIRLKLRETNPWASAQFASSQEFIHQQGGGTIVNPPYGGAMLEKTKRQRRASNLEQLTNEQAALFGYSKDLTYHDVNISAPNPLWQNFSKFNNPLFDPAGQNKNELSEVSVLQPDGTRYIYGLPAMNTSQEEGSFRIKYDANNAVTGQNTAYEHTVNLINTAACLNQAGTDFTGNEDVNLKLDGYFQRTKMPAYAHSWLLTTVVSSDYVDITGNGPSDDDYGYWVKFNYKKQYSNYKWRVPYTDVSYNPGHIGDDRDNMGNYMYGTKEIYFIETVETKTHLALFETSARRDAFEAQGPLAAIANPRGPHSMHRLDKIKLFVKAAYIANPATAIPLQTVNFGYDYSLCPGVPNNNTMPEYDANGIDQNLAHGKLALKKLWFTYQNNNRGKLSPYIFDYSASNPAYNPQAFDKWGNYRKTGLINAGEHDNYPVIRFPYTLQDVAPDPSTWLLTRVTMPSGGKINVEYESDDYAYVQDKPALQMFDIAGIGSQFTVNSCGRDEGTLCSSWLEDNTNAHVGGDDNNYRIYFKMEHIPTSDDLAPYIGTPTQKAKQYVREKYIRDLTKVYFNVEEHMYGNNNDCDEVAGYADILRDEQSGNDFYGAVGTTIYAYITLKKEPLSKKNVFNKFLNPFQVAGFTHIRSNRPELIFPNQTSINPNNSFALSNVYSLLSFIPASYKAVVGINRYLSTRNYCKWIHLNGRSIIRLSAPDAKVGGGVRVKKLYIEDTNFESVGDNSTYGQEFDYTMTENGEVISSGVAYEPQVGGDESALREPVDYTDSHLLKSALNLFTEKPILQNYYPGASVGYRKVTVRSLVHALANGGNNDPDQCHSVTPVISYEFYTPKDFPVITDETDISPAPAIVRGYLIPGIKTLFRKSIARSQGYSIVLNDMAGKLRKLTTYVPANPTVTGSTDRIISQEEYIYKTKAPFSPGQKNELDCKVDVMEPQGICSQALVGETSEIFVTMDENKNESSTDTYNWNVGFGASFPFVLPIPLPTYAESEMSMKTTVTTKVIYRTGILIEQRKFDGQATVVSDNLVFDQATGAPLLAQVNNEFNDHIFNYSIPAHWFYTGMSSACSNQGYTLNLINASLPITIIAGGQADFATTGPTAVTVENTFEVGDELWITPAAGVKYRAFVIEVLSAGTDNAVRLIKEDGSYATGGINNLYVIRSGKRNQLTSPAGGIELNVDPRLQNSCDGFNQKGATTISLDGVLNASAIQYSQFWNKSGAPDCGTGNAIGDQVNPLRNGMLGIWRPYKSYAYLDTRDQHDNIREDGVFNTFSTFNWNSPANSNTHWKLASTITKYSPQGYEIENKDPLGTYSSALYGYGNSLVTAVAANARYTDIISESFEDYPRTCTDAHWVLNSPLINTTSGHTGTQSLRVNPSTSYAVGVNVTTPTIGDADLSGLVGFDALIANSSVLLNSNGMNGVFTPVSGREYFVSAWVNEVTTGLTYLPTTYANSSIQFDFYTNSSMSTYVGNPALPPTLYTSPNEQIVDGWQRISGKITIPATAGYVRISFKSLSASSTIAFDDFRMLPSKGAMKAFVYDPLNLRHIADLDDNNFATFYVYDDEGKLIMKRVETSEGIRTIAEGRTGTVH